MTKFNKVGKSTFVIAILSFLLVAVLAFGGTYAYFSAETTEVKGDITMGALYVDLKDGANSVTELGDFADVNPNEQILRKDYTVDFTKGGKSSTIAAFVRVKVVAELTGTDYVVADGKYTKNNTGINGDAHITPTTIFSIKCDKNQDGTSNTSWFQNTAEGADGYTYYVGSNTNAQGASSNVEAVSAAIKLPITITVNKEVGRGGSQFFMGATGTYSVIVEVIQAEYLKDSATQNNAYTVAELAAAWEKIEKNTADPYKAA